MEVTANIATSVINILQRMYASQATREGDVANSLPETTNLHVGRIFHFNRNQYIVFIGAFRLCDLVYVWNDIVRFGNVRMAFDKQ